MYVFFCSNVVACWEKADLLALLYVMFSCLLSLSILCSVSGVVLDYGFLSIFALFLTYNKIQPVLCNS